MNTPKRKRSYNMILMCLVHKRGWVEEEPDDECWHFVKRDWRATVYFKRREIRFSRVPKQVRRR